ncbi:MAG TPA: lipopolysaccharide heptosyltransferase II [Candidatus Acidoferrum sp.]|nr:lipopolysaccharide heptosyltransferase II [Candidatus Acidoferrum sp.]
MKVLILKPSSLGDVVQAIPVLRMLKLHHPAAEIYWWVETNSAALLEGDPDLAGLIRFDRKRWGDPLHVNEVWNCIREIRAHHFDLVIDLQALLRSAAVAWIANGAFTVGLQDWRELALGFYDRSVPRPSSTTHAVDWYLDVLKLLDVPVRWDFEWLPKRETVAAELAKAWKLNGNTIVLQPGARWLNKRWPTEHFAEVVRLLHARDGLTKFVIIGGNADRALGEAVFAAAPEACIDLTGRTTLPEAVEIIRSSRLMVTNDTGPMHIAAALNTPVVGLFGPTNPARTGPYRQQHFALQRDDLACVPCLKNSCANSEPLACLRGISPARVAHEVAIRLN